MRYPVYVRDSDDKRGLEMDLFNKPTLNDFALLGAEITKEREIRRTKNYVLSLYMVLYKGKEIKVKVQEYKNANFVVDLKCPDFQTRHELKKEISKDLEKKYEFLDEKEESLYESDEESARNREVIIKSKLFFTGIFRSLCFLLVPVGLIMTYYGGVLPFVFLPLIGIDGIILTFYMQNNALNR